MKKTLPTSRTMLEGMLTRAEAAHAAATKDLTEKRAHAAHTQEQFYERGDQTARASWRTATEDLDRAEHLSKRAEDELAKARSALDRFDQEAALDQYNALKAKVAEAPKQLAALTSKLVALDRELDAVVISVARLVGENTNTYRGELEPLAAKLGLLADLQGRVERLTLPDARLTCQRAVAHARAEDGRDDLSDFLRSADMRWQTQGMSAAEIASISAAKAKAEKDRAFDAGAVAGALTQANTPQPRSEQ